MNWFGTETKEEYITPIASLSSDEMIKGVSWKDDLKWTRDPELFYDSMSFVFLNSRDDSSVLVNVALTNSMGVIHLRPSMSFKYYRPSRKDSPYKVTDENNIDMETNRDWESGACPFREEPFFEMYNSYKDNIVPLNEEKPADFIFDNNSVTYDHDKNIYTTIMKTDRIECKIEWDGGVTSGFTLRTDNGISWGSEQSDDWVKYCFCMPRTRTKGTFTILDKTVEGYGVPIEIDGVGYVSKVKQTMKPYRVARKWRLLKFHSPEISFNMTEASLPHGGTRGFFGVSTDNGLVTCSGNIETVENNLKRDHTSGYDIPTSFDLIVRGNIFENGPLTSSATNGSNETPKMLFNSKSLGNDSIPIDFNDEKWRGANVEISLPVPTTGMMHRWDVLYSLPWLIRKIVQVIITRPWGYSWLNKTTAKIKITAKDGTISEFSINGLICSEMIFLNP